MRNFTDEDRYKARVARSEKPNDGSAIINGIKNRKHCNTRCIIFDQCPMMPLSLSRENPNSDCLLNKGGNVLIRRFINLMAKGEDGLLNEINNTLYSYAFDIETAPPSVKKDYAMMCMKLHEQLYASQKNRDMEMKPNLTVVINEMDNTGKIREITPILEAGPIGGRKLNKEAYDAVKEEDPESLLTSPLLEDLMKNVPTHAPHHLSAADRNTEQGKDGKFRRKHVQEPDTENGGDASSGTEGESKELAETPPVTDGGT